MLRAALTASVLTFTSIASSGPVLAQQGGQLWDDRPRYPGPYQPPSYQAPAGNGLFWGDSERPARRAMPPPPPTAALSPPRPPAALSRPRPAPAAAPRRAPSTAGGFRSGGARPAIAAIAPARIAFPSAYAPGSIIIDHRGRQLFLIQSSAVALRYPISVGREGFGWTGTQRISRILDWPDWHPPASMRARDPRVPVHMSGGLKNPLGVKALYLGNTLYRIHGTNDPTTIGRAASSGCFRMLNGHVIDLASRVGVGTPVTVVRRLPPALERTVTAQVSSGRLPPARPPEQQPVRIRVKAPEAKPLARPAPPPAARPAVRPPMPAAPAPFDDDEPAGESGPAGEGSGGRERPS